MLFTYTTIDKSGKQIEGTIDAYNESAAIASLQRRGFVVVSIEEAEEEGGSFLSSRISFFDHVSNKEVVILSRQISTLFAAQVSALQVFRLLAKESENVLLQRILTEVADDIQSGNSIAKSLEKHPKVFSHFYVNMVRAGEEAGKLSDTFIFLADYLDRTYEVTSKAKNALVYPSFIISTFKTISIVALVAFTLLFACNSSSISVSV